MRLSHDDGKLAARPNEVSARTTRPLWSKIGAENELSPAYRSPTVRARPRRRTSASCRVTARRRAAISPAREYLPAFGLAGYCGFGRLSPAQVPAVLDEHRAAISAVG
jgi:hypothetical protein